MSSVLCELKLEKGHEIHLGTNCLGPFLFTHYLTPILCQTAASSPPGSVRITWAASLSVDFLAPTGGVEFDDIGSPKTHRDHRANYAQSKVGNIFLAKEFATELSKCGVINVVGYLPSKSLWLTRSLIKGIQGFQSWEFEDQYTETLL